MRPRTPEPRPTYGAVHPDELLPLPVVKARLRWGDRTISEAQRRGLRVLRFAKWKYVRGADLIDFLERVGADGQADGEAAL